MTVWDDVVGQPAAVTELTAAAADPAAMTHAWLFTGPPGSGRSVAARAFAAALQCPEQGCGHCAACHTVLSGTHADVREIIPEGLSIGVKGTRQTIRESARHPSTGPYQILLIQDADRLTEQSANALLRFIEEPPTHTVFLMCSPSEHPDDVPTTIRSRCRIVRLQVPDAAAIAQVLVARDGIEPDLAAWAGSVCAGHIGRARHLARDANARAHREKVLALPLRLRSLGDAFASADEIVRDARAEAAAMAAERDGTEREELHIAMGGGGTGKGAAGAARSAKAAEKDLMVQQKRRLTRTQRDAIDRVLVDLTGFFRDVLVAGSGADVAFTNVDRADDVRRAAAQWSPESTLRRLDAVLACRTALDLNVKPEIAAEAMMTVLHRG